LGGRRRDLRVRHVDPHDLHHAPGGLYWLAILFTFALGTAAGDLVAEKASLGYGVSIAIFGGVIVLVIWLSITRRDATEAHDPAPA
jgi:uncharacterized membrane-anchored protein